MPPPLGIDAFFFPVVRPSVRSPKYPLSTCTRVRWSIRPTVTIFRPVRLDGFQGISRRTHGGNSLKFYMLMYPDHFQNWLNYAYSLLIFLILALFWLTDTGQICGFWAFLRECMEGMAGLSVDVLYCGSRAPTIWISMGPKQNLKGPSIEIHYQFSNFGRSIGPLGKISQGPHWIFRGPGPLPPGPREPWNGLKFCILMYPDHLQNWLGFGHGLLIFLLLASFWLSRVLH